MWEFLGFVIMKQINRTRIIRNKHLLFVSSVKPYFLSAKKQKSGAQISIGTQCEKYEHKRSVSECLEYYKNPGITNNSLIRKLNSRPTSPVTIPITASNYIASSKKRFESISKSYDFAYKASARIIENKSTNHHPRFNQSINSQKSMHTRASSLKISRKVVKLSNSPILGESSSNLSIDYFVPRYKNL